MKITRARPFKYFIWENVLTTIKEYKTIKTKLN